MEIINGSYDRIISLENLLEAWQEFILGKRSRNDVQQFQRDLMANIIRLHQDLKSGNYRHSAYSPFKISDPKPRNIHKAIVRDRLLHRAIYRVLYPIWDKTFILDSYSCRKNKGTHKAFKKLVQFSRRVSRNYTGFCWALKLDIKKFFDSVDHRILMDLLEEKIEDQRLLNLLQNIVDSFEHSSGKGMPLGNLTSQLFANIYLDPLDKFVKHVLKLKHYLRYADDFVLLATDSDRLLGYLIETNQFLKTKLKLTLHPNKIILRKLNWGIDYVGYVALSHYNLPRRKTVQRIFRVLTYKIENGANPVKLEQSLNSYLGYLQHVSAYNVSVELVGLCR